MTFEQLYAPILNSIEEKQAKNLFVDLVTKTLERSSWEDTPCNRLRAEELAKEEIAFIIRYESPTRAATIRQWLIDQTPNAVASTP